MPKTLSHDRVRYPDRELNEITDSVASVVRQLNKVPLLLGQLLEGVSLSAPVATPTYPAEVTVRHTLGSSAKGAIVVKQSVGADVKILPSLNSSEIVVQTSEAVTVSLWVF